MRRYPNIWTLAGIMKAADGTAMSSKDGVNWYPARPLGFQSFDRRVKAAWLVFTGRADAVVWPEDGGA